MSNSNGQDLFKRERGKEGEYKIKYKANIYLESEKSYILF